MTDPRVIRRALREHFGESQQAFAMRMGWAIRTVARYETVTEPTIEALTAYIREAQRAPGHIGRELTAQLAWRLGVKNVRLEF